MISDVSKKDTYPLLLIKECSDMFTWTEFVSTLGMQFGYWQIEVHPEDYQKTSFLNKQFLYEFTHMPFGLCNSLPPFQRALQSVFHGMTWREIFTYLDEQGSY